MAVARLSIQNVFIWKYNNIFNNSFRVIKIAIFHRRKRATLSKFMLHTQTQILRSLKIIVSKENKCVWSVCVRFFSAFGDNVVLILKRKRIIYQEPRFYVMFFIFGITIYKTGIGFVLVDDKYTREERFFSI